MTRRISFDAAIAAISMIAVLAFLVDAGTAAGTATPASTPAATASPCCAAGQCRHPVSSTATAILRVPVRGVVGVAGVAKAGAVKTAKVAKATGKAIGKATGKAVNGVAHVARVTTHIARRSLTLVRRAAAVRHTSTRLLIHHRNAVRR